MYEPNVKSLFTYLRGRLDAPGFEQSRAAMIFAMKAHEGQKRKQKVGGVELPYIVHPFQIASDALSLKGSTDDIVATAFLHDVCEDCNLPLSAFPKEINETVKKGVKYITISKYGDEDKLETKKRYYRELIESKEALVVKGLDGYNNLNTMESSGFEEERIVKNILEKHEYLMPSLKIGKYLYPEMSDALHDIREKLAYTLVMMARHHNVELVEIDESKYGYSLFNLA
jgi:GTP pyrophosphokinase